MPDGITNVAQCYSVSGVMQNWNYLYTNDVKITIEVSCFKCPPSSDLSDHRQGDHAALLIDAEHVRQRLLGFILDGITRKPIRNASFTIAGAEGGRVARSWTDWCLPLTNKYQFYAAALGCFSLTQTESGPSAAVHLNFTLTLLDKTSPATKSAYGYSSAVKVCTPAASELEYLLQTRGTTTSKWPVSPGINWIHLFLLDHFNFFLYFQIKCSRNG